MLQMYVQACKSRLRTILPHTAYSLKSLAYQCQRPIHQSLHSLLHSTFAIFMHCFHTSLIYSAHPHSRKITAPHFTRKISLYLYISICMYNLIYAKPYKSQLKNVMYMSGTDSGWGPLKMRNYFSVPFLGNSQFFDYWFLIFSTVAVVSFALCKNYLRWCVDMYFERFVQKIFIS